jgi:hypothetical protein
VQELVEAVRFQAIPYQSAPDTRLGQSPIDHLMYATVMAAQQVSVVAMIESPMVAQRQLVSKTPTAKRSKMHLTIAASIRHSTDRTMWSDIHS